jgi:hypothetical protein
MAAPSPPSFTAMRQMSQPETLVEGVAVPPGTPPRWEKQVFARWLQVTVCWPAGESQSATQPNSKPGDGGTQVQRPK